MKYTFHSKIVKKDMGYTLEIPFNVWEICKREGDIPVKVTLSDTVFVCNLAPKGNGYYDIPVQENIMKHFNTTEEYKVTFRITKSSAQESPYSTANPIRQIDSVTPVIQPHDGLCGQACVAMLAGITLEQAINDMHCGEWQATIDKIVSALNYYGIDHSEEIIYTSGNKEIQLPDCCVILEKMGRYSHYLVYYHGKGYDSNLGVIDHYDFSKMKGYVEIYTK